MEILSLNESYNLESDIRYVSAVVSDGVEMQTLTVDEKHPNYESIAGAIEDFKVGDLSNEELAVFIKNSVDLAEAAQRKINSITRISEGMDDRLTISDGRVLIDYEPIDAVLEGHILRMLREDGSPKDASNWLSFVKFVENLYGNQSEYIREQLFGWMQYENAHGVGLTLTPDGCIIGYKGCAGTVEEPVSVHSGPAIVNGQSMNGHIPNVIGSVIEMPRSSVQDNPEVGCASGLHIGTYNYAKDWAHGVLLTVKFNPRDVVSVPTECDAQKVRVCRYEVIEAVEGPLNSLSWGDDEDNDWDEYWDDYNDDPCDCGECDCDEEYEEEEEIPEDFDTPSLFQEVFNTGKDLASNLIDKTKSAVNRAEDYLVGNFFRNAVSEGLVLEFDYVDAEGRESYARILKVEGYDADFKVVSGVTSEGKFRSFKTEYMSRVRVVEPIEEKVEEEADFPTLLRSHTGETVNLELVGNNAVSGKVIEVIAETFVLLDVEGEGTVVPIKSIVAVN